MIGEIDPFALPGMGLPTLSTEVEFLWGIMPSMQCIGVTLDSTAVDANSGNTPTTTLIRGLVLGMQTATNRYAQYNPAATDGTQIAKGLLYQTVNMLNPQTASAVNKEGRMVWWGNVKATQARGLDLMARRQLGNRIWFDDGLVNADGGIYVVNPQAASYTVLAGDNNTTFTTTGATGAVTFTLPTCQRGLRFRFFNKVAQNMIISAPANTLIAMGAANYTTATYSTSGQLIGAACEVIADEAGANYMFFNLSPNTVAFA
jgi:hypothetical protein